ncbi:MAG: hypothetical protein M1510_12915 [Nitrospirae bacterium]|nr:hypothetical protein [Nitrospirota bacterium]
MIIPLFGGLAVISRNISVLKSPWNLSIEDLWNPVGMRFSRALMRGIIEIEDISDIKRRNP